MAGESAQSPTDGHSLDAVDLGGGDHVGDVVAYAGALRVSAKVAIRAVTLALDALLECIASADIGRRNAALADAPGAVRDDAAGGGVCLGPRASAVVG